MSKSDETVSLPFGVEIVAEDAIPEAPRKNDRDDDRWSFVRDLLNGQPGQWFKVKEYDTSTSAGIKASAVNGGKNKTFPSDSFEARYTRDKEKNTSALYLYKKV